MKELKLNELQNISGGSTGNKITNAVGIGYRYLKNTSRLPKGMPIFFPITPNIQNLFNKNNNVA